MPSVDWEEESSQPADLFGGFGGSFDSAGHPLNAIVFEGEKLCGGEGRWAVLDGPCAADLLNAEMLPATINIRLAINALPSSGRVVDVTVRDADGVIVAETFRDVAQIQADNMWQDVAVAVDGYPRFPLSITLTPGAVQVRLDYVEMFPQRFELVLAPGAGVVDDDTSLIFEAGANAELSDVRIDNVAASARLRSLVADGQASIESTQFRTLWSVPVGALAPDRADVAQLLVQARDGTQTSVARTELRRAVIACDFVGAGPRVLLTGFQPFPASAENENVSAVAVQNARADEMPASVMRLILPVEYDRAADLIQDVVERCEPDYVISFGQGGGRIGLEQTAYNLKDAAAFPDNRGIVQQGVLIDDGGRERSTRLPLERIASELQAIDETPHYSDDPGRYICNNVMYRTLGAMAGRGGSGFIHLPYVGQFDDAERARFGRIAAAAVRGTVAGN